MTTATAPYPSEYVLVPRRKRRIPRWFIALLVVVAAGLAWANMPHSALKAAPRVMPSPVAHVAPRPAAPQLSAKIGGKTYACTVVAAPTKAKR